MYVNELSSKFNLSKPANSWAETHKYGENYKVWLDNPDSIFKLWKPFVPDYKNILESYNGNIVVSYTENIPLFVAKLLRAECTRDWGINRRAIEKISFYDTKDTLIKLTPVITDFISGIVDCMSSRSIVLKSAFINNGACAIHIQSSFDVSMGNTLKALAANYKPPQIDDYISIGKDDFYEFVCKTIGCTL